MGSRILVLLVLLVSLVVGFSPACTEMNDYCVETLDEGTTTETSATLCGRLTYDKPATVGFEFWETQNYLQEQNPTVFALTDEYSDEDFYWDVGNLQPGNSYSYKAWAEASGKRKIYGDTVSFTTEAQTAATILATGRAENITTSSATLYGDVVSLGMASSLYVSITVRMPDGGTVAYTAPGIIQAAGEFSVEVSGLAPDTTYYYWAEGSSTSVLVSPGEEKHFTTTKAELTILNSVMEHESATVVKVTGQAKNTGTILLTYAEIRVVFKDNSGTELTAVMAFTQNLDVGEVWDWEVTTASAYVLTQHEVSVTDIRWT